MNYLIYIYLCIYYNCTCSYNACASLTNVSEVFWRTHEKQCHELLLRIACGKIVFYLTVYFAVMSNILLLLLIVKKCCR